MHDDHEIPEYDERERAMFAALPRESASLPGAEERLVGALRADGYFRGARRSARRVWQLAAAAAVFAAGAFAGAQYGGRNSLERVLERTDLTLSDRVLLLQRAGSAYVRAANGYADAAQPVDSTAIEVATQVLMGAARAVARHSMDAGMTSRLSVMLQTPGAMP